VRIERLTAAQNAGFASEPDNDFGYAEKKRLGPKFEQFALES
jgi:hypothetical protein